MKGVFEKRPGEWYARWFDHLGRKRVKRSSSEKAAHQVYLKKAAEVIDIKNGLRLPEEDRPRMVLFKEIAEDVSGLLREKKSFETLLSMQKTLIELFGNCDANAVEPHEMEQRLKTEKATRGWTPATYNRHRQFLMLIYQEAKFKKKVRLNVAREIRREREPKGRVRFLSRGKNGEYGKLLKAIREVAPEHLADFILALATGLRLSNLYLATYEMIDWDNEQLVIPKEITKNEEDLIVPLTKEIVAAIQFLPSWGTRKGYILDPDVRLRPTGKVDKKYPWFKAALQKAGISDFTWHDLRHTFASWLVQDGVPLERVSKLCGHKSLTMTMRYAHLRTSDLHEAAKVHGQNFVGIMTDTNTDTSRDERFATVQ